MQAYKPGSVSIKKRRILIIYLGVPLPKRSICLPSCSGGHPFPIAIGTQVYVAFHRIEFTWFHYSITCTYFLLHLSYPPKADDGR